jgi:hypothetical protein
MRNSQNTKQLSDINCNPWTDHQAHCAVNQRRHVLWLALKESTCGQCIALQLHGMQCFQLHAKLQSRLCKQQLLVVTRDHQQSVTPILQQQGKPSGVS